ncbi:hypothetical protein [Stagnimonas aquatica]|nr:hypothetical protein [Stagnimonas aquatica]
MKMLLPLRHFTMTTAGVEEVRAHSEKLRLLTLGQLLGAYGASSGPTPRSDRLGHLEAFVAARNWLVHHLISDHGFLASDEQCQSCIERLDRDYEAAFILANEVMEATRITIKVLKAFLDSWVEVGADIGDGQRLAEALALRLAGESVGTITLTVPLNSVESILAIAMERLQKSHVDKEGWTHFNAVGQLARQEISGLPKGLLAIARQIPGFKFEQRPAKSPNASWMFRRTET